MQGQKKKKANKSQQVFSQRLPFLPLFSPFLPLTYFLSAFQCFWPSSGQIIPSLFPRAKNALQRHLQSVAGFMADAKHTSKWHGGCGEAPAKDRRRPPEAKFIVMIAEAGRAAWQLGAHPGLRTRRSPRHIHPSICALAPSLSPAPQGALPICQSEIGFILSHTLH